MTNFVKYSVATVVLLAVCINRSNTPKNRPLKNKALYGAAIAPRDTIMPERIAQFAETLRGTPYHYGSSDPTNGFDCSGFITYVFNHFGLTVPRSSIDFANVGTEVSRTEARRGDLILFTGTNAQIRHVGHMGIVTSNTDSLHFIHSTSGKEYGVTTTALGDYYNGRFMKIIRVFDAEGKLAL